MTFTRKELAVKFGVLTLTILMGNGCLQSSTFPVEREVGWVLRSEVLWEAIDLSAKVKPKIINVMGKRFEVSIKGRIKIRKTGDRTYKIKNLFINQRYIKEDKKHIALIEITPIFTTDKIDGTSLPQVVDFTVEESLQCRNFGTSYFRIKLGDEQVDFTKRLSHHK